jgi:hypothetical protein
MEDRSGSGGCWRRWLTAARRRPSAGGPILGPGARAERRKSDASLEHTHRSGVNLFVRQFLRDPTDLLPKK